MKQKTSSILTDARTPHCGDMKKRICRTTAVELEIKNLKGEKMKSNDCEKCLHFYLDICIIDQFADKNNCSYYTPGGGGKDDE